MSEWLSAAPPFLVAAGLLVVPGLAVRLAGWNARSIGPYLLVPALSVAVVAVAANLAPVVRLPWSLLPVVVVSAVAAVAAYALRRWVGHEEIEKPRTAVIVASAGGFLLAAILLTTQLVYVFVAPGNVSQTFDNIVHLNSIRLALDSANASALQIGATSDIGFYPDAWHSLVTLAAQTTGAEVPAAVNATNIAIGAIAWPLSAMALAAAFFRDRAAAIVTTAALSTGFAAFPVLMMSFGVLYPNATGYAVLPAGLAAVWWLLRAKGAPKLTRAAVALVVVTGGIGLGHPNAVLALFAMSAPLVGMELLLRAIAARRGRAWALFGVVTAALLAAGALLWRFARTGPVMSQWGPWTDMWTAIRDGALLSPRPHPVTLGISILILVGLVGAAMRPRRLVLTIPFFVVLLLFVVASGTDPSFVRDMLTNPWYNDSNRLAALLPVGGIPVATMGALVIVDVARRLMARWSWPKSVQVGAAAAAAIVLFPLAAWGANVQSGAARWRASYALDEQSVLLTSDELAVISRLTETTDADALILGDPWTGTSLAYALGNRQVVERHVYVARSADELFLESHLGDIDDDPAVCAAVTRLGITHVLDFGSQTVFVSNTSAERAGLDDLAPAEHLVLVDSEGDDARLFRIEGC